MTPEEQALDELYQPEHLRVGILLVGDVSAAVRAAAAAVLIRAGHTPERRLATLRPRVGEPHLRVSDVLQFLALYGAEYAVTVIGRAPDGAGQVAALLDAAHTAGSRTLLDRSPA